VAETSLPHWRYASFSCMQSSNGVNTIRDSVSHPGVNVSSFVKFIRMIPQDVSAIMMFCPARKD